MKRFLILLSILICGVAYAATETINWYIDGQTYATTTCQTGGDIILPTTPTKRGYTFQGWTAYTPIEYIESTGTQWVDTGIIPDENTNVKVKASYVRIIPSSQYDSVIGSTVVDNGNSHRFYPLGYTYANGGKIRQTYGTTQYEQTFDTDIHTVDFNNANKQIVVDGTVVGSTTSGFVKDANQPSFYLFATNVKRDPNSAPEWYGAVRLYALQIYNNGTLVRDFIPVLDLYGIPCMYDKVEKKFYYNAGTGQFIAGPVLTE